MNKITIILLTLAVSSLAFAQTIIEERVEIEPQRIIANNPESSKFKLTFGGVCRSQISGIYIYDIVNELKEKTVTLQIVEGSEYASFYDFNTGSDLGSYVQATNYTEVGAIINYNYYPGRIRLRGKDSAPFVTEPQEVTVQADIDGNVVGYYQDYFPDIWYMYVYIFPDGSNDTLRTGESTDIEISFWNWCQDDVPVEMKVNLEILKGAEYGSLIDPVTGEKSKILNDLDPDEWILDVYYIADGISPEEKDSVIIRISTTDPNITPVDTAIYIKPPPVYVYTLPEVVGANDTADVIIKHRLEDGTLEDFPPGQTFELSVLDGCVNGNFLVDTTINVYFADAQQPIKFITADSLDSEENKILIRVGTNLEGFDRPFNLSVDAKLEKECKELKKRHHLDSLRTVFNKMRVENKIKLIKQKTKARVEDYKEGAIEPEAPVISACASNESSYPVYWKGFADVVEGDGCDEEIVVCENIEPQTLSESSFVMLRGDKDYIWVDKNGKSHTSNTGNACLFDPPAKGRLDLGKCYTFEIIGNYTVSTDTFNLLDDALIKACLDQTDPNNLQWQFNIENLKIPVFADVCPLPEQYVDLIDGDQTKILNKVPNCDFYNWAVERLDYYIKGPYYQPKDKEPPYPIVFSTGILAHEDEHFEQTKREVIKYFNENETFKKIRDNLHFAKNETQSCPESATALVENLIKEDLKNAIIEGSNLHKRMGTDPENNNEYNAELLADKIASETYKTIKLTFKIIRSQVCN